jgi:hypothetical protein
MADSLYSRIRSFGTLAEIPAAVPDARFALPSTIHWVKALAILVADLKLEFATGRAFYRTVQPRNMPEPELNTVFEQLLFVLNQISALKALTAAPNKADVARTAIVTWYYGVYPQHHIATLAGLAEAGEPLSGTGQQLRRICAGAQPCDRQERRRVVRVERRQAPVRFRGTLDRIQR